MTETLANITPNTQPSPSPSRSLWAGFNTWFGNIWESVFGQQEARERAELAAKTRAQLQELANESQKTPKIIRELAQARKDILQSNTPKPEWHAMMRLRDMQGQSHDITYDPREGSKSGFKIELVDYSVEFAPVGGMNGYNTHFTITAIPKKTGAPTEEWQLLALRYPIRTPAFQALEEERLAATTKIAEIEQLQKNRAQELMIADKPPKSENLKARIIRTRRIATLRTQLDTDDKTLMVQKSSLDRVNRAIEKIKSKYLEMIYSPYSPTFNTPEVRKAGFTYLKDTVTRTWAEDTRARHILKGVDAHEWVKGIEARAAIDSRVGIALAMVERMDFVPYLKRYNPKNQSWELKERSVVDAMMQEQLERALATLGVNGENTYTHQRNTRTRAAGIAQITPEGQDHMTRRYGSSILPVSDYIPDHTIGPSDPVQSLRFMQVHLIDQIQEQLPSKSVKSQWGKIMASESTRLGMHWLLAAGYNGSMSRVVGEALGKDAGKQSPEAIYEKLKLENVTKSVGKNMETLTYVMKFAFVWRYLEAKYPQEFAPPKPPVEKKPAK
jgi:hypothetical protein